MFTINKKFSFIFLIGTIFIILYSLFIDGIRLYPHLLGSYSMEVNYYLGEPENTFLHSIPTIIAAILMIALGWYAKPIFQRFGSFSLGGSFILELIGELTRIENALWFKTIGFLPLIIALISFSLDLKEKHSEQQ